jgi:alpha-tubulin suppressor-like RCC1 family protein
LLYFISLQREIKIMNGLLQFIPNVQIAASCHNLFLTEAGLLYVWGGNGDGQLGFWNNGKPSLRPSLLPKSLLPEPIKMVAVGNLHSLILTVLGQIYVCGSNYYGQLGLGNLTDHPALTLLPSQPEPIKMISSRHCHNLALTASGQVYVWGSNRYSQLGLGDTIDRRTPILLSPGLFRNDPFGRIKTVIAGDQYSLVLTTSDQLYAWGDNQSSQLGLEDTFDRPIPTSVVSPQESIRMITAGNYSSAVLTVSGQMYLRGACCENHPEHCLVPTAPFKLFHQPIMKMAIGIDHWLFLTVSGQIHVWKNNAKEQINLSDTFKMVTIGTHHSFALTVCGRLYVWGQNRKGELGLGDIIDRPTPTLLQMP